jgi:hypothetical protein
LSPVRRPTIIGTASALAIKAIASGTQTQSLDVEAFLFIVRIIRAASATPPRKLTLLIDLPFR